MVGKIEQNYEYDINLLINGDHFNPHQILGVHRHGKSLRICVWSPSAPYLYLEVQGKKIEATLLHEAGLFGVDLTEEITFKDYRIYRTDGTLGHDPYAFLPSLGETDCYLFNKGTHYEVYKVMGGRLIVHQDVAGARFTVWAPNAKRVAVVGDFNHWDGRAHPMRSLGESGIWELFVPALSEGMRYKFEIKTQTDQILIKSDPYALWSEVRPANASKLCDLLPGHVWQDGHWMEQKRQRDPYNKPMCIYEVHLGSWKKEGEQEPTYLQIADQLSAYCLDMGFTHIELMPICEHPLDESWGYQVTGYYAVTSRYGTPRDFQEFVSKMHLAGIGVILDWVPAHFPSDDFALACFDGTYLYEHADPKLGFHPHWNTLIYNYGRAEVTNFLIGSALFWFDLMHIDGLRVDAVASMLYLDYGREEGQWIPNQYGGKENLQAIEFLKHLNSQVHERFPGVLMIAEESTSFTGVTHDVAHGGLGFDLKWNMGWMNDTLAYFEKDPFFRNYHHYHLTFGLLYAYSEKFMMVLSHDEVVHCKRSLISKMPGDEWQRFANMRLLYSYMICQPGKKLLFMGGEIGQWNEWYCKTQVEWHLLRYPIHDGLKRCIQHLNLFYQNHPPLWEKDFTFEGFEWVDFADTVNSVISYRRKGLQSEMLCVHNFTPTYHENYHINLKYGRFIREIFNTDEEKFGGCGKINPEKKEIQSSGVQIQVAPLATQIFEIQYE